MSFADLIRQRVQAGLKSAETNTGPLVEVLHELAEGLRSDTVGAEIMPGEARGRLYLTLWPRLLPARRHLMLAFWVTADSLRVFTDPPQEFSDPSALREWLADFVTTPAFLESLVALSDLAGQPTEGYLRAAGVGRLSGDDLVVEISAPAQRALVDQPDGTTVELTVAVSAEAGAGSFDPNRKYVALESSGVRLDDVRVKALPTGGLLVRGTKRTQRNLRAEFDEFDREVSEQMAKTREP
ncbi:MAG TPA: hypothetical protein VFS43_38755 [Polyangiaceae bacterium]|nr:hypothetical protein [Polyangiaceae bacterium]